MYRVKPYDLSHYSTNLQFNRGTKKLTWDSAQRQDVILLQMPFGRTEISLQEICRMLGNRELPEGKFEKLEEGVWIRFVSSRDARNGCPMNHPAATYWVISCDRSEDECVFYEYQMQGNNGMIAPSCNVQLEATIHVGKDNCKRKTLFGKEDIRETGFYKIVFPDTLQDNCEDGDICIDINEGIHIPVTRKILEAGTIYVKTGSRPAVSPRNNKGIRINID